jgi:hypothetical protein
MRRWPDHHRLPAGRADTAALEVRLLAVPADANPFVSQPNKGLKQ